MESKTYRHIHYNYLLAVYGVMKTKAKLCDRDLKITWIRNKRSKYVVKKYGQI